MLHGRLRYVPKVQAATLDPPLGRRTALVPAT
ncbi:MAG: hypothetical protein QG671_567 [Actinomycetota bacterium]|nr:hypothetical protein [Actinomycetota bacterium]